MPLHQEIVAAVICETYRFGEAPPYTVIMQVRLTEGESPDGKTGEVAVKGRTAGGELDDDGTAEEEPAIGLTYRFIGDWVKYKNKWGQEQQQFHFTFFMQSEPLGRHGIVSYLQRIDGITKATAIHLVNAYESDTIKMLREQPEQVGVDFPKLANVTYDIALLLTARKAIEHAVVSLMDLISGYGLPYKVIMAAAEKYGSMARQFVTYDPFKLLNFSGAGFRRCDKIYAAFGLPPGRLKRQAIAAGYYVGHVGDGNTWEVGRYAVEAIKNLAGKDANPKKAIELAVRARRLARIRTDGVDGPLDWDGDTLWIGAYSKARNENLLAKYIVEALNE